MIEKVEVHWNCDIEMEESERNHVLKLSINVGSCNIITRDPSICDTEGGGALEL